MDNDAPLDGNDDDFMEWLKKHKLQSYQQALEEEASSMIIIVPWIFRYNLSPCVTLFVIYIYMAINMSIYIYIYCAKFFFTS